MAEEENSYCLLIHTYGSSCDFKTNITIGSLREATLWPDDNVHVLEKPAEGVREHWAYDVFSLPAAVDHAQQFCLGPGSDAANG